MFWFDICSDDDLGYRDKATYLKDIFLYLKAEDIVLQDTAVNEEDSAYSICTFIVESDEKFDDAHVKEFLKRDIMAETVEKILNNHQMDTFSEKLNNYRDSVVQAMIRLKYFKYTRSRYNEVLSAFSNNLPLFAEYYWGEFEPEIPSITLDLEIINRFIESNLDDEKVFASNLE